MVTLDGRTKQILHATGTFTKDQNTVEFIGDHSKIGTSDLRIKTIYFYTADHKMVMEEYWITPKESRLNMKIIFAQEQADISKP
jgi:hypothetical protein